MPTAEDLKILQANPLSVKIGITQTRIIEWYEHYKGQVYISFSGGKDSTVLLDLARRAYPDIEAVFVDTGLEYPEIRDFVKTKENVTWLHPIKYDKQKKEWVKTSFKDVLDKYGYPVVSKSVSRQVGDVQKNGENCWAMNCFNGNKTNYYDMRKWEFLINAPFKVSDKCCGVMKKAPLHQYEKNGFKPITATMTCESNQRKVQWVKRGCNSFNGKIISNPMSFWTEQDVLLYIKKFNIPYCNIYGYIIEENGKFKTTGLERTGCMFCMFGCHLEKEPNRFQRMKETHPKQYDYCINKLGLGKVLDYIGVPY